ncbi:MAG: flagellar motor stator protein MotA [Alphaproteobacteria bacterium]
MFVIIGIVVVFVMVFGGFMAAGGHMDVIVAALPFEMMIIGGAGAGALIIANPKSVLVGALKGFGRAVKGPRFKKADYVELLSLLYQIFRLAKTKGMLALESHVENPHESALFAQFPKFVKDHHALEFVCDYLRLLTLGTDNPHEVESIIDEELETHHSEEHAASHAMTTLADGLPALGIVAAVLGVIKTMGSIDQPPEILGYLIGSALVGTFLGIFLSYGLVGPMANACKAAQEADAKYMECIKTGLLAHMQGYAPQVSIEFARKTLLSNTRPTFTELEEATGNLPAV